MPFPAIANVIMYETLIEKTASLYYTAYQYMWGESHPNHTKMVVESSTQTD